MTAASLEAAAVLPSENNEPVVDLERRIRQFETRLYHALLLVRAGLPVATFAVIASAAAEREISWSALVVWGVLAVWTATTVPFLWQRLGWVRRLPLVARLEIAVFVLLVFLGFGTRAWHLLHSFVPLVFAAFFASRRVALAIAASIVGALWEVHVAFLLWPQLPIERPLAAVVPTAIVVATTALLISVRRVLRDVDTVVVAQRDAVESLISSRWAALTLRAKLAVYQSVADRLSRSARLLAEPVQRFASLSAATTDAGRALLACLAAVLDATAELRSVREPSDAGVAAANSEVTLSAELRRAAARTDVLDGEVILDLEASDDVPLDLGPLTLPAFRRLVTEALVNARKHGNGVVRAAITRIAPPTITITNEFPHGRTCGRGQGLDAMRADASVLDASVNWRWGDGTVDVTIEFEPKSTRHLPEWLDDGSNELRRALSRGRFTYERAALYARLAFAVMAVVTIRTGAAQHRSLLPALTATALFLVLWNLALLGFQQRLMEHLARRPHLLWVDAALMVALTLGEGGMASPWMPLSMGTILFFGLLSDFRWTFALVAMFGGAMLAGYGLMRVLPLDDAGTRAQNVPFGWLLNVFVLCAVAGIAFSAGWIFSRLEEASAAYREVAAEKTEAEGERAGVAARAEARRELHASLEQYIRAALVRVDLMRSQLPEDAVLDGLERQLEAMRDALKGLVRELIGAKEYAAR